LFLIVFATPARALCVFFPPSLLLTDHCSLLSSYVLPHSFFLPAYYLLLVSRSL
jgi:hypothetical protein